MKNNNIDNQASQNFKRAALPLIIFTNLFPIYGVITYNWTIFSIVYLYWLELLIVSTFQLLKILTAEGDKEITMIVKLFLAIRFFLFRTGIFLFYLLFIVTFLGLLITNKENSDSELLTFAHALTLKGSFYRITLTSFFIYNLVEYLVQFRLNGKYKTSTPNDNFTLLDPHIIVVHIVVVLGTFLYAGVTEKLSLDHHTAIIACAILFAIVKIIADVVRYQMSDKSATISSEKYI